MSDETRPWGADFDPAKAWTLIENLRGDTAKLRSDIEAEKAATPAPSPDAASHSARAAQAERALWIERALRKHPTLYGAGVDTLTGSTEAEVLADAERLSAETAPPAPPAPPEQPAPPAAPTPSISKPRPDLTPGHGGEKSTRFDAASIVEQIWQARR